MKVIILPVTLPAWLAPCGGRARPLVASDDTEQRSDAAVSKRLGRGGLNNRPETAGFWRWLRHVLRPTTACTSWTYQLNGDLMGLNGDLMVI